MRETEGSWMEAGSLEDLCRLGARFARGGIDSFPGWGWSALDTESDALVPALVRLNEAGLLTLASQPGFEGLDARDGARIEQRAFVTGFASPAATGRLRSARWTAGIEVRVFDADASETSGAPVTLRSGIPRVLAGHDAREAELACFEGRVGAHALAALARAPYVCAIDLVWGRELRLFEELVRVLAEAPTR